ncbi:TraM recognition domain-containing protein [Paenibacillus chibensis]|uniref:TraM recognition domain-containing protein n=1 Tax=Paenibacillus chibensis TaxID=59846 RepID=UPI0013E289E0|nr:TraM recognition domain-containing protein [Paenibacillus chibensis]MEC0373186.1 type IV secretion system DNA-binding domain-containing protein [Paenibacillus chibensis]
MARRSEEELLLPQQRESEGATTVGYIVIAALAFVLLIVGLPAVLMAAVLYGLFVFVIKKPWILYAIMPVSCIGLFVLHGAGEWASILGFLSILNIPILTEAAEQYLYLHGNEPFRITSFSYASAFIFGNLLAGAAHPFIDYYRSKIVKTKYDALRKKRSSGSYRYFRAKRFKLVQKAQLKFRKSNSKENFIGYDEFQERVALEPHEPNQHVFAVATTGGGKTVIIGTMVENAIRQDKPVVFMDGKGERASMLEFKELCERYGKRVHMFTDVDEISFNFLRHGSATQLRDKIMNLFEWSEPYYKLNCSRFLQLVLKMMKEFDLTIDLKNLYDLTYPSKVAAVLNRQLELAKTEVFVTDEGNEKAVPHHDEPNITYEDEHEVTTAEVTAIEDVPNAKPILEEHEQEPKTALSLEEIDALLQGQTVGEPNVAPTNVRESAASLFEGLEPAPVSVALDMEPEAEYVREGDPLAEESLQEEPVSESEEEGEPPRDTVHVQPAKASALFTGMEEETEQEEPAAARRLVWDEARRARVEYYRERFFGIDDEEESTGIPFGTLTSLRNQLAELMESDLGPLFEETGEGIDLKEITDRDEVAIFSLSGNKYRDYIKTLGRLVISEVNTLVDYRQKEGKKSIMSVYDEFSAYVSHEVVDVINKSRSAGFECLISVQGLSDIDAVDPVLTRQIINNCNTYFVGRVNESEDASTLAATFGTYEDGDITKQVQKTAVKLRMESEMGTVRSVQRFRAHPDEIKTLATGEVFLARKTIEKNGEPYVARVYVRNALDTTGIPARKEQQYA